MMGINIIVKSPTRRSQNTILFNWCGRYDGDVSSLSVFYVCYVTVCVRMFLYLSDWLSAWLWVNEWASESVWICERAHNPIQCSCILVLLWIYLYIYRSLASSCLLIFCGAQFSARFGSIHSVEILSSIGLKVVCFFSLLNTAAIASIRWKRNLTKHIRTFFISSSYLFNVMIFYDANLFICGEFCAKQTKLRF